MAGASAVAVADLALPKLESTIALCEAQGAKSIPFACDVSNEDQVERMIEEVEAQVGGIDILINVAGVCNSKPIFFENFSTIWRDIEINLGGVSLDLGVERLLDV